MPRAAGRCLLAAGLGSAALAAPAPASAASSCRASALELGLLGATQVSAIAAGGSPCVTDRGGVDLAALGVIDATAVEAVTDRSAVTTPGADARVAGLDLGVSGFTEQLTAPLLSGPNSLLGQVSGALTAGSGGTSPLSTALAPLSALGLHVTGTDAAALLSAAATGLPGALQAALPDIAHADVLAAGARAQCVGGRAVLSASTDLTGLKILGTTIDPDDPATRAVTLDSAHLTLGQLVNTNDVLKTITVRAQTGSLIGTLVGTGQRSLYDVLTNPGGIVGILPIGTTMQQVLDNVSSALQPVLATQINLPDELLHVLVTPRRTTNDGATATATTLQLGVSVLGQEVLSGAVARASITAGAADCGTTSPPPVTPPQKPLSDAGNLPFASMASQLQLQCGGSFRLIDVRRSGNTTLVRGVAKARFVGRTVDVILAHGKKKVGSAVVKADGTFATRVPLPPASIRGTNAAFYYGQIKTAQSNRLKFTRRMEVDELAATNGAVTFKGRTTLPRSEHQKVVVLKRRVTCTKYVTVGHVHPDSKGRFSATFKAPTGATYAIYRAETRVPKRAGSKKTFETYTLPRLTRLQ
ncbi:MAG: hypothetical protein J7513_10195 [Solirubrobacteraceae bacterium]|nr:hypothetical protein [Solirubrobacteraceae bacterium]